MAAVVAISALTLLPAAGQDTTTSESTTTSTQHPLAPSTTIPGTATLPINPDPACASPYLPVEHQAAGIDRPWVEPGPFLEGVTGQKASLTASGGSWSAEVGDWDESDEDSLFTVTFDDVTRVFTTAGLQQSGHYTRTPGPDETHGVGVVSMLFADGGEIYIVLGQYNSGTYANFSWRFDDPCLGTLSDAGESTGSTGSSGAAGAATTTPRYTG